MLTIRRPTVHNFTQQFLQQEHEFVKKLREGNRFSPCPHDPNLFQSFENTLTTIPEWTASMSSASAGSEHYLLENLSDSIVDEKSKNTALPVAVLTRKKSQKLIEFLEHQRSDGKFSLSHRDRVYQTLTESIELCLCELDELSHKFNFDYFQVDVIMNTIVAMKYLQKHFPEEAIFWTENFEKAKKYIDSFITEKRSVKLLLSEKIWD